MTVLREQVLTSLPIETAFSFVADFANAQHWDPGVASSERIGGPGPVGPGARYALGIRMAGRVAPMEYVVTRWDPPRQVVLAGSGSGVEAVDDIRFTATADGTRIDYTADIRLRGLLRFMAPFAGGAFAAIARNARDGMKGALDRMSIGQGAAKSDGAIA